MKLKHKKMMLSFLGILAISATTGVISSCTLLDKLYPKEEANKQSNNKYVERLEQIFNIPSLQKNKTNLKIPKDTEVKQQPVSSLKITTIDDNQAKTVPMINDIKRIEYNPNIPLNEIKNNKVLGQLELKLENGDNLLANVGIRLMLEELKKTQGFYELELDKNGKIVVSEKVVTNIKDGIKKYAQQAKEAKEKLPKQLAAILDGDYLFGLYINIYHKEQIIQSPKILNVNFNEFIKKA